MMAIFYDGSYLFSLPGNAHSVMSTIRQHFQDADSGLLVLAELPELNIG